MKRPRACDVAEALLRETDNPAVMWGDTGLLDTIAERLGYPDSLWRPVSRWKRTLDALSRTPGQLIPGVSNDGRGGKLRTFWLPEHAPEWVKRAWAERKNSDDGR